MVYRGKYVDNSFVGYHFSPNVIGYQVQKFIICSGVNIPINDMGIRIRDNATAFVNVPTGFRDSFGFFYGTTDFNSSSQICGVNMIFTSALHGGGIVVAAVSLPAVKNTTGMKFIKIAIQGKVHTTPPSARTVLVNVSVIGVAMSIKIEAPTDDPQWTQECFYFDDFVFGIKNALAGY